MNDRINSYTLFDTFMLSSYFVDFYSKWLVWLLIRLAKKLLIWFSCKEAKTFNFYVNNWLTYSYLSHICSNQVKITKIHFHFSTIYLLWLSLCPVPNEGWGKQYGQNIVYNEDRTISVYDNGKSSSQKNQTKMACFHMEAINCSYWWDKTKNNAQHQSRHYNIKTDMKTLVTIICSLIFFLLKFLSNLK